MKRHGISQYMGFKWYNGIYYIFIIYIYIHITYVCTCIANLISRFSVPANDQTAENLRFCGYLKLAVKHCRDTGKTNTEFRKFEDDSCEQQRAIIIAKYCKQQGLELTKTHRMDVSENWLPRKMWWLIRFPLETILGIPIFRQNQISYCWFYIPSNPNYTSTKSHWIESLLNPYNVCMCVCIYHPSPWY